MTRIAAGVVSVCLILTAGLAQEPSSEPSGGKPVWRASELGRFIADRMVAPSWEAVEDDARRHDRVEPFELRLQLQVIEAHAVGQALRSPFQPSVARDAYQAFFNERFSSADREPIRLGLQQWGVAYSGAVQLGKGNETATLGHIRRVFANSLKLEKSEDLAGRGPELWRKTLAEVSASCQAALRRAVVVPD